METYQTRKVAVAQATVAAGQPLPMVTLAVRNEAEGAWYWKNLTKAEARQLALELERFADAV